MIQIEQLDQHDSLGDARTLRARFANGRVAIVHVARYPLGTEVRLRRLDPPRAIEQWSVEEGFADVLSGGFFTKPITQPLGLIVVDGEPCEHQSFRAPWDARRGAMVIDGAGVLSFGPLDELDREGARDVLQAGPLLVAGAEVVVAEEDPEGFASTKDEFDSDITDDSHPRAGIAVTNDAVLAVVIDGRSDESDGLRLPEFAELLVELGATDALNLDGGASASLITGGLLRNNPRGDHGEPPFEHGFPTCSAFTFVP